MEFRHKSVLLEETIENLNIKPDGIYVDGTLGGAGHAYEVAKRLTEGGRLIGIDQDADAIAAASQKLEPLKNRVNIVITRNPSYKVKDAVVVHSVEEAIEESRKYDGDVFVIGGESIYRAMLPYCDTALVTRIDYAYEADTWFPNLDEDEEWELTDEGEEQTCFDLEYAFTRYERK